MRKTINRRTALKTGAAVIGARLIRGAPARPSSI